MKMTKNKFFSLPLMWEGIKQTKTIGICFIIISLLAVCISPFSRMITLYSIHSMDYHSFDYTAVETISLSEFLLPKFVVMYFVPIILILSLFRFMNKRDASDFYHSAPLNRTCVYITYSAVTLIWSIFIILLSTIASLICYSVTPNVAAIPPEFVGYTILSSFILTLLVMSITLVAKGLSGTGFSNIVVTLLIMLAPRAIIFIFARSIINATVIVDISALSIADPSYNIIFSPLVLIYDFNSKVLTSPSTMWYSIILAIIYFALGLFLHKKRKSETAGTSSSFKFVQHIVRIAIGIIPTLIICYVLASREGLHAIYWVFCIGASILFYFLYELVTTRNVKKLIRAIPWYLVVIVFNLVFIFGNHIISDSIISDIPEASDIESVSIYDSGDILGMESHMNEAYNLKSYYSFMAEETKIDDKDLIKILQESLAYDVEMIKSNDNNYRCRGVGEEYKVTFHLKSGRELERTVYINKEKYLTRDKLESGELVVLPYLSRNKEYMDNITVLPTEKEVASINFVGYASERGLTSEQKKEIWDTFRDEYNELSYTDRIKAVSDYNENEAWADTLDIKGYHQNKEFTSYYYIYSKTTPKTFNKLANIINENSRKNFTSEIMNNIAADKNFRVDSYDEFYQDTNNESCESYYMSIDYGAPTEYDDLMLGSNIDACFPSLKSTYYGGFDDKNFSDIRKIVQMIYDTSSNEFDSNGTHPICFSISLEEVTITKQGNGVSSSGRSTEVRQLYVNLTDDQYKEISDILGGIVDNTYGQNNEINEGDTELIPVTE